MVAKSEAITREDIVTRFQQFFYWLLLTFVSILSVSGTIALRNILHVVLLCMFAWALLNVEQRKAMRLQSLAQEVPPAVWVWIVFLLLFPLVAVDSTVAWRELALHWSESMLTWILAFATVAVLRGAVPQLLALTIASAVPVLLHLALVPLFMAGLLRGEFEANPSLYSFGASIWSLLLQLPSVHMKWQSALGFRGIEPMHGNIGYPASQTLVLALACWLQAKRLKNVRQMWGALSLVFACLLSGLISSSRGTVIFNLWLVFFGYSILIFVSHSQRREILGEAGHSFTWKFRVALVGALVIFFCLFLSLLENDQRWQTMMTKLKIGLSTKNPLERLCNGLSFDDLATIRLQAQGHGADYENALTEGLAGQDGARMLLLRAGVELVATHPRGQDGSREAFQEIMEQTCGHAPKLAFAHAHNAWINLALSLGWLGLVLFLWLLLTFARQGWHISLRQDDAHPIGFALFLLAVFWGLRGLTDAVYQEHYLQMQAFFLLFFCLSQSVLKFQNK